MEWLLPIELGVITLKRTDMRQVNLISLHSPDQALSMVLYLAFNYSSSLPGECVGAVYLYSLLFVQTYVD